MLTEVLARPGETLTEHTLLVLERVEQLRRIRPLPEQVYQRLWYAALLHDSGKLARGFQRGLRQRKKRWGLRHEVLSLAFVAWFDFSDDDRLWVAAAIATHHRDLRDILRLYRHEDVCASLIAELDAAQTHAWYEWLQSVTLPEWVAPVTMHPFVMPTADDLRAELTRLRDYEASQAAWDITPFLLRGSVLLADHAASARTRPFDRAQAENLMPVEPYPHQFKLALVSGMSARLTAPTGSGKTEAALLWAFGASAPRVFYLLPYRASMNAMAQRLEKHGLRVGLQHGHALRALYRRFIEEGEADPAQTARAKLHTARLHADPVRVFSPYHLLRALYRFKGYEADLTDCYASHMIVDEIHAYEPERLAMLLETLRLLRDRFDAQILIMTATFPPVVAAAVARALPQLTIVEASAATFQRFRRHTVHVETGDLSGALERIHADWQAGKAVLVTVNTVRRAREVTHRLVNLGCPVLTLHSRFNSRDRWQREKAVLEGRGQRVVVATQVIEVSLNVDFDVLYSDPAPLDALLQRFGRVNRRGRLTGLAPVHIFDQPLDLPVYDPLLVQASVDVLRVHDGQVVDEALINTWLAAAYAPVEDEWQRRYEQGRADFRRIVIDDLRPFDSADEALREQFAFSFDGIEILPLSLEEEYLTLVDADPIAASELLVPLAYWQYKMLERQGRAWRGDDGMFFTSAPYSPDLGLMLEEDTDT